METRPASTGVEAEDRLRAAWMAAAQDGDGAAYERLLLDCLPLIRSAVARKGLSPPLLDDVVQEVLLTVHRVRHTYDPRRSFNGWLWAIAQRRAIDALRGRGRRLSREVHDPRTAAETPDPAEEPHDLLLQADARDRLRGAITTLPAAQREAVERLGLEQLSLDEAAEATGRSQGALKVNLHRALKTLRARLTGVLER